jgi:hypothetical protein
MSRSSLVSVNDRDAQYCEKRKGDKNVIDISKRMCLKNLKKNVSTLRSVTVKNRQQTQAPQRRKKRPTTQCLTPGLIKVTTERTRSMALVIEDLLRCSTTLPPVSAFPPGGTTSLPVGDWPVFCDGGPLPLFFGLRCSKNLETLRIGAFLGPRCPSSPLLPVSSPPWSSASLPPWLA